MFKAFLSLMSTSGTLALLVAISLGARSNTAHAKGPQEFCSPAAKGNIEVEFINKSSQPISFHWMKFDCSEGGGPKLAPGQSKKGITFPGHIYRARGKSEQILQNFVASRENPRFVVDDALIARIAAQGEPYTEGSCSPRSDGRFTVEFINHLNEPITMQWIGFDCKVNVLRKIPAKGKTKESTFPGHVFRFVDSSGRQLRSLDVARDELTYHISDD